MSDTVVRSSPAADGHLPIAQRRTVDALVWAVDDERAAAALEHLRHALWPYWYRYEVAHVKHVERGGTCPLQSHDTDVLAFTRRTRWMWVLVRQGAAFEVVASCS